MINLYPKFSKIDINLRTEVTSTTSKYEPVSDFNFTNLFTWDTNGTARISILNDNLVIVFPDFLTNKPICSIIGTSKTDDSIMTLLKTEKVLGSVPEIVIESIRKKDKFKIKPDPASFDYVYKVNDLVTLPQSKYKKKRSKVKKVENDIGKMLSSYNTMSFTDQLRDEIISVFDRWVEETHRSQEVIGAERISLQRLLLYSNDLNIIATLLRIHGRLIGFSLNELLSNNYAICHFEKASMVHGNIYTYLVHQASLELNKFGVKYVNWEQDLGLEGLRKSKQSYHPYKMLKKYSVSLTNQV